MYIPSYFVNEDRHAAIAFMKQHSFAVLSSIADEKVIATHLPFVVKEENGEILLYSHLAKANPQASSFEGRTATVIFQGEHGYISPKLYKHTTNVPTWNYQALHVEGVIEIVQDAATMDGLMHDFFQEFEPDFAAQYLTLAPSYKEGLLQAVVGFKLLVSKIYFAEKLSQNKTIEEQERIARSFVTEGNRLGEVMLGKLRKSK